MKKVAVLMGGWSAEREISIQSAKTVYQELVQIGFDVTMIDVKKDLRSIVDSLYSANPDYIINALHGTGGEDGTIQGVLDIFGVPYSNSGVLGSAISFDKAVSKILAENSGVRVVPGKCIKSSELNNINEPYPFIIKPTNNGSSVGVFLIKNKNDLLKIQSAPWPYGDRILVEKFIPGREFTVLVIEGEAIGSLEITYQNEFYDFDAKYSKGGSTHLAKYDLSQKIKDELHEMAVKAYNSCLCKGIARADFRYDGNAIYFMEINTQPGTTSTSLVPDILKSKGITISDFWKKTIA